MRRLAPFVAPLLAVLSLACDSSTTLPSGNLQEPVALTTAQAKAGPVVFVANATDEDLRAFFPNTQLFARGSNAVSAGSIVVGFRPTRLASGTVPDPSGTGALGYAAVAGAAPEVALIDAQTLKRTHAAADACPATPAQASCLPAPATDVATAGTSVFAPIGGTATAAPQLATFHVSVENGAPVLALDALLPLTGTPGGVAATSDGTRVYVADRAAGRVIEVTVPGGGTRDIAAAGPVEDVVLSPAYTGTDGTAHPEGEFLLAILSDGGLQTLSPAAGGPAADPNTPTLPVAPLRFASPVRDLVFIPCAATDATCPTVRLSTSSDPVRIPGLGFAALGDGTAVGIQPIAAHPQVFTPVTTSPTAVAVTTPLLTVPNASRPASPTMANPVVTPGFTLSEAWTVTFKGVVPGFTSRPGTLSETAGAFTIDDADPAAFSMGSVMAGDTVTLSPLAPACASLGSNPALTVTQVGPGTLTVTPADPQTSLAGCAPLRVNYQVRAGGTLPWTVVGSASGFVGRAGAGTTFIDAGARQFYDPGALTAGPALSFQIVGTNELPVDSTFTFTTNAGLSPLRVGTEGLSTIGGQLANAVTATKDQLYIAQVASNHLVQATLAILFEADAVKVFQ